LITNRVVGAEDLARWRRQDGSMEGQPRSCPRRRLPTSFELEIVESQALQTCERLLGGIQCLADTGISLAMDDFGTGYSSIDTLSELPCSRPRRINEASGSSRGCR
jgi:EAL domain-containing protein (putative c-di-GMP-specific phosphodiesterase class I)